MARAQTSRILLIAAFAALFHVVGMWAPIAATRDKVFSVVFSIVQAKNQGAKNDAQIEERLALLAHLEQENQELRQEKGVAAQVGSLKVLTKLLWFEPNPALFSARIDQGGSSGLGVGGAVTAPGGILVGRVKEVFPHSSRISFLSDPSFQFSVVIGQKRILGFARAASNGMLTIDFVSRENLPQVGDKVFTAGKEDLLPRDLVVGTVQEAVSDPKEPFGKIIISPEVSPENLLYVFVHIASP